jgi:hypothetical protein
MSAADAVPAKPIVIGPSFGGTIAITDSPAWKVVAEGSRRWLDGQGR